MDSSQCCPDHQGGYGICECECHPADNGLRDRLAEVLAVQVGWDSVADMVKNCGAVQARHFHVKADAILGALGLEHVGWYEPAEDEHAAPEVYDLDIKPYGACEPVYRLKGATHGR